MRIAVTCIQLIRDIDAYRPAIEQAGIELTVPEVAGQHLEGAALVDAIRGCDGVVAGDDKFTREVIEQSPGLRVISKWGIGVDGIDHDAAVDHGIVVRNTPGMFDDEVADVSMAYVTGLARQLHVIDRGIRAGLWPKPPGLSLRDTQLGIIGLGGIGRALAVRGAVAGMHVVGFDPAEVSRAAAVALGVATVELDELLATSHFVSVNCPLNPSTYHLLDERAFAVMRRGAYLINTGRGPVVSTAALVDALDQGIIAGAALDVLEDEPPPPDHPLRRFEQVVFGSHNASNTLEASARVHARALANLFEELALEVALS